MTENALSTFHTAANVAVFGASGGIGQALVRLLEENPQVDSIHAVSRSATRGQNGKVRSLPFDLSDEASIAAAITSATSEKPLDLVIVATGILHQNALQPEKTIRELDPESMMDVLRVNTIGPALIAKHALPQMRRGHKSVFAALSARVGSISDNRLGGWTSYRMSKSALNMILRTLSIEQTRKFPDSIVVALHPGTVDTRLSKPFTARVPESRLFTSAQAAGYLLNVIEGLAPDDTGGFFAWDGTAIGF